MRVLVGSGTKVYIPIENVDKIVELKSGNALVQNKSGDKTWTNEEYYIVLKRYKRTRQEERGCCR